MVDLAALETRLLQILTQDMNLSVPGLDADLVDEGLLDSLTFVELLFRLEKEFALKVAVETLDLAQFRTVRAIASFVHRQRRAQSA